MTTPSIAGLRQVGYVGYSPVGSVYLFDALLDQPAQTREGTHLTADCICYLYLGGEAWFFVQQTAFPYTCRRPFVHTRFAPLEFLA